MGRRLTNFTTVFLAWWFCCGCVTKRLWEEKAFNEPSPQPNLQLYYSEVRNDMLVAYDELHEPSSTVVRRCYYLKQQRDQSHKPLFVDLRATNQLHQIPVLFKARGEILQPETNTFAVLNDAGNFSLHVRGEQKGPYELPVYPSGFHQGTQIALTPAAVVADTVIAGTVVGLIIWAAHGFDAVH